MITSATVKTGFQAASQLLTNGYPVTILVRAKNAIALELEKMVAEIAMVYLANYDDVKNVLSDVKRVYL